MTQFLTPGHIYGRTNNSFEEVFNGCYECDLIVPPLTDLDIGANEGAFTAWAQEKWPECQVQAYEPMPDNAAMFRSNHQPNPRVTLSEFAVVGSDYRASTMLTMHYGKNNSGECSTHDLGEQQEEGVLVGTVRAEHLKRAQFVK